MKRCTVPDCGKQHTARGLCRLHYDRLRSDGPLPPLPPRQPKREVWVCECPSEKQDYDAIGECRNCRRPDRQMILDAKRPA